MKQSVKQTIRYGLWKSLVVVSFILSLFWFFAFWYLYNIGDDLISLRELPPQTIEKITLDDSVIQKVLDSISYSQQVGRLDIISILLGFFGIMLAVATIGWAVFVRSDARRAAREEIRDCGKQIIADWLENNPDIIIKAIQDTETIKESIENNLHTMKQDFIDELLENLVPIGDKSND